MRQITTAEKVDPLTRIQEEIKEVARREQELRELLGTANGGGQQTAAAAAAAAVIGNGSAATTTNQYNGKLLNDDIDANASNDDITISSQTPSLTSSVNSKESLDENHSDDSGISASSSPVNGISTNEDGKLAALVVTSMKVAKSTVTTTTTTPTTNNNNKNNRGYIRPNGYNPVPLPPPQKILTRTVSTPQIFTPNRRTIPFSLGHKGLMQRFIASRGKIPLKNNNNGTDGGNTNTNNTLAEQHQFAASTQTSLTGNATIGDGGGGGGGGGYIPWTPPAIIARDANGKPIRRGYIPVEVKIQKELKDLKNRESELKKIRKIRQSTPDLLDSINNEALESDEDDSEIEHCYGPGKLRTAKSISELCDSAHSNNSLSTRTTPSPDFDSKIQFNRSGGGGGVGGGNGMRPAVSLAQLCDLDPEEAPSSHRLIAQWENLIQQNA